MARFNLTDEQLRMHACLLQSSDSILKNAGIPGKLFSCWFIWYPILKQIRKIDTETYHLHSYSRGSTQTNLTQAKTKKII